LASTSPYNYPDASIDPRKKGLEWLIKYANAAFYDRKGYQPLSINQATIGNQKMSEIRLYSLGKQPINKYRKILTGTEQEDNTWLNLDWSVANILSKFREIAISKIMQVMYDVQASAVDPMSRTIEDEYFNKMKVKIMMRQAAEQAGNQELAQHPMLKAQTGEPEDEEQLQIDMEYGYKTEMEMEAEQAITLILQQNDSEEYRKSTIEDWYDFGIAGYKQWIDENGMVKFRAVKPENLVISYCQNRNFSDAVHMGEGIQVQVNDLVPFFTRDQIIYICKNIAGKWGNPASFTPTVDRFWDSFKVLVFDLELITWNTYVYKDEIDGRGNERFGKTAYENLQFVKGGQSKEDAEYLAPMEDSAQKQGSATPKYMNITKKVKYKIKWIVGTDFAYDYGEAENQPRKLSSWWDTQLNYHCYAWNFNKMMFSGITERLIPIQDNYQLTWMRLQNLKAKLIPYLITLDLDALENVALGKGGEDMTPKEIVNFMFENNVFVYRSGEVFSGKQANYNPAAILPSGQLQAFTQLYEDLRFSIQQMRDISGLNEVTDGSSPNAKMLTTGLELANQGTNNAIYMIMDADRKLLGKHYDGIMQNIQIAVKLGKVEGYVKALGTGTVRFLNISPDIALSEFGIFVNPVPTAEERQQLIAELNLKDSQGLIDPADKITVMTCTNLKQAAKLLAYRVKKRQEQQQQFALQQTQVKQQGDAQIAMQIEQMRQQTIMMQTQGTLQIENLKGEWMYKTEMMKKTSDQTEAQIQAESKTVGNQIQAEAKKEAAHIAAGSHLAGTHLKGQADLLMTEMDNNTAKETAKKKTA
jgi:hypothetical protein